VSPSEIAFLALGLLLGSTAGAALAQSVARRTGPRRQVRLTIIPNAIPSRRAYTLAVPSALLFAATLPGSPDARAQDDEFEDLAPLPRRPAPGGTASPSERPRNRPSLRTAVPSQPAGIPSAVAVPVVRMAAQPSTPTQRPEARLAPAAGTTAVAVAVLQAPAAPPVVPAFTTLVRPRPPVEPVRPTLAVAALGLPVLRPVAIEGTGSPGNGGTGAAQGQAAVDPCASGRRLVDERCSLAGAAREQARSAADALREAQRVYDVLRERVDRAQATADPRQVAAAKERLHADFRIATERAGGADETEAAARVWLNQINELNAAVREAQRMLDAGNAELRAQVPVLDRLAAEADAARITGENAEAGCRDARQDLAACEEAVTRARAAVPLEPQDPDPFEGVWPADQPDLPEPEAPGDLLAGLPVVVRILRGDRDARQRLVASLTAGDAEGDWQLRVARLVDAINARAIEDGYLDVPDDDPFWRLFERREARDIVGALSALGYRYDGLGGFADGRVPAARDLSLAVGYAGLDRMRIRTWPRESEIERLYERAVVASDEWLADEAGDLSLGRMVDALGNRAAELADVWNAWGRMRPALLER
jgi:hypothetical protein